MGLPTPPAIKELKFWKFKMADGRHFEKKFSRGISTTDDDGERRETKWTSSHDPIATTTANLY